MFYIAAVKTEQSNTNLPAGKAIVPRGETGLSSYKALNFVLCVSV